MAQIKEDKQRLNKALLRALQNGVLRFDDVQEIIFCGEIPPISEIVDQLRALRDSDPDAFYAPRGAGVTEIPITRTERAAIIRILKSDTVNPSDVSALNLGRLSTPFDDVDAGALADSLAKAENFLYND